VSKDRPDLADGRARHGLASRKAGRNAAIVAARREGQTLAAIARAHGITTLRVSQILAKYGAPPRE
jgi:transposase-like protein